MGVGNQRGVLCPHCGRELVEGRDYAGTLTVCPFCRKVLPPPMPGVLPAVEYPEVDLSQLVIDPAVLTLVPAALAREKRFLPLAWEDQVLTVVMDAPPSPELLDSLRFLVNHPVAVALTSAEALHAALEQCYPDEEAKLEAKAEPKSEPTVGGYTRPKRWLDLEEPPSPFEKMLEPDHESVLPTVQSLLRDAYQLGASRLVIVPDKDRVKVGYCLPGAIHVREDLPPEMLYALLCTLITMTDLSGHIKVSIGKQERQIHLTFSTTPEGVAALVDFGPDRAAKEACRQRAERQGYLFVDLEELEIPQVVLNLVSSKVARAQRVLPVAFDGEKVTVVLSSPRDPETLDQLRFALNRPLVVALATEGAIVAAIDRYYGSTEPETVELIRKQLAAPPAEESAVAEETASAANHPAVAALRDFLGTIYRPAMFAWFDEVRANAPLCQIDPASGELVVVFAHADVIQHMPAQAQAYIDKKIWIFREAIVSRLQAFLERDPLARGLAASYALYLASCQLAEGKATSLNPGCLEEAWLNCLYALLTRSFPTLTTNGVLAKFLAEHPEQLSARVAARLNDPALVTDVAAVPGWLARLERLTSLDESLDGRSALVVHLQELLVAEALRGRASQLLLLPQEDQIEVAYRVQTTIYGWRSLPLRLFFPLLDRLGSRCDAQGQLELTVEGKKRAARLHWQLVATGLALRLEFLPDPAALATCRDHAMISGHRMVDLSEVEVPAALLMGVPKSVVWKKQMLPLGLHGNEVTVALNAPPTPRRLAELKLLFRRPIVVVLAPEDVLGAAIYRHLHPAAAGPDVSPAARALLSEVA